jgi:hypothetical protein
MKSKPQEKTKKAIHRPSQHQRQEMSRKQRRETMRKIQSDDLSLEAVHPHAAGIDIGNDRAMAALQVRRWRVHPAVQAIQDERTGRNGAAEIPGKSA